MENVPRSLPKRGFLSDSDAVFTSHKSVYDDVFGGPSKFGLAHLAPRLEDYSEIFGGFHSSRSSSIPLLHLPILGDDSHFHFDVRIPGFDYGEVFGGIEGFPFTASFQDLFGQCGSGCDDSSDDEWSPAQSEALSDELDPLAESDKNCRLSDGEDHRALGGVSQLNVSYEKSSLGNMKTVSNASAHVADLSAFPQYSVSRYKGAVSWHGKDDHSPMDVTDDINSIEEFGERVTERKLTKNWFLNPLHGGFDACVNDFIPSEKQGNSPRDKPFMTVSDISLRTKPSQLPPPSRPPPALVVKHKDSPGRVVCDSASILFDMKEDNIFSEDRANRDETVEVKHESDKESVDGKDVCSLNAFRKSNSEDERIIGLYGKETIVSAPVIEDRIRLRKSTEETSESWELHCFDCVTHKSANTTASREASEYNKVIENRINKQTFNMVEDCDTLIQHMTEDNYRHQRTIDHEEFNQKESSSKFIGSKEAPKKNSTIRSQHTRCDEEKNPPEMSEENCDWVGKQQSEKKNIRSNNHILRKLGGVYDFSKNVETVQQLGESEDLRMEHNENFEECPKAMDNMSEVEDKLKLKAFPRRMDIEERFIGAHVTEHNSGEFKLNTLRVEHQRRFKDVEGERTSERVKRTAETEEIEKQYGGASEKESGNKLTTTLKVKESGIIVKEDKKDGENANNSYGVSENEICGSEQYSHGVEGGNESLEVAAKQRVDELIHREAGEQDESDEEHKLVQEREVTNGRSGDTSHTENNDMRYRIVQNEAGNEEDNFELLNLSSDASIQSKQSGPAEEMESPERNEYGRELKMDLNDHAFIDGDQSNVFDGGCKLNEVVAGKFSVKDDAIQVLELNQTAFSSDGQNESKTEPNFIIYDAEAGLVDTLGKEKLNRFGMKKYEVHHGNTFPESSSTLNSPQSLPKKMTDSSLHENMGVSCVEPDKSCSQLKCSLEAESNMSTRDGRCGKIKGTQFISKKEDIRDTITQCQEIGKPPIYGNKKEDAPSMCEHRGNALYSIKTARSQRVETKDKNVKESLATKDQKGWERMKREAELENTHMRKVEEEREREREREKDRMTVDKVALEAHERSYAEARERAERAAVERTTAEVRLRAMASTRERLEKPSIEARLRTERVALERATAEAQQRAAEKSSIHKAGADTHDHTEKLVADRFSASFRSDDTRQSSLSSDLLFQNTVNSKVLRYSYSSALSGAEGESPQRCKARLERYRRTAERAANALAEKNRRDILAQKEREERNRVAEVLDAEIKRWSSGKEGNLRALLSTLQYILGPDCGWQPVPLTEVITSAAVKRSYRKAALCVHPDKLQQRGATIQQKYICEKVFDLLKEAWNMFNSEEC